MRFDIAIFKVIVRVDLDPRLYFLLETIITVKSRWNAQTKKVWAIFGVFDIQQIVVLYVQTLYYRHVVQVVSKRRTHCRRPCKHCVLASASHAVDFLAISCPVRSILRCIRPQIRLQLVVPIGGLKLASLLQKGGILGAI